MLRNKIHILSSDNELYRAQIKLLQNQAQDRALKERWVKNLLKNLLAYSCLEEAFDDMNLKYNIASRRYVTGDYGTSIKDFLTKYANDELDDFNSEMMTIVERSMSRAINNTQAN